MCIRDSNGQTGTANAYRYNFRGQGYVSRGIRMAQMHCILVWVLVIPPKVNDATWADDAFLPSQIADWPDLNFLAPQEDILGNIGYLGSQGDPYGVITQFMLQYAVNGSTQQHQPQDLDIVWRRDAFYPRDVKAAQTLVAHAQQRPNTPLSLIHI